jgi:hypothetical protein
MDGTRKRRTRDLVRQAWYAGCRQRRFARFLGFGGGETASTRDPASGPGTGACWRPEQFSPDRRGSARPA